MPSVFDQIHAENNTPPPVSARNIFDQIHAENVDLRPKNVGTQPDTPVAQQGMFESIWSAVKNIADPIHDAVKSGDMGAHAADEFFRGLLDKAKEVASGNTPLHQGLLDASGAQAAGNRMQQQADAGNYSGAAGSALGYLIPFFAPKVAGAAKDAYSSVSDAADALSTAKGVQVAKIVARHVSKKITGPINLANDISEVVTGDPIGVLPRRTTAAAKAAPVSTPAAEMSAEDLARQRNILETRRLDQTALRSKVAAQVQGDVHPAPVDAPVTPASLHSTRIPGNTPAYDAQWEPSAPIQAPAQPIQQVEPAPVPETAPAPVQAQAATAWKPVEEDPVPVTTADHDMEIALQRSIEAARARKGFNAGAAPVVSPQNEMLNAQLNGASKKTAADIIDAQRTRRAIKLGKFVQEHGFTADHLDAMTPEEWNQVGELADVSKPSTATVQKMRDLIGLGGDAQPLKSVPDTVKVQTDAASSQAADQGPEVHSPDQQRENAPVGKGHETTIDVPGEGVEYRGRYAVRELSELNPSHNGVTFERNPKYPHENDRDYSNPVNQERVVMNSLPDRFKPRYLITDNSDAGNGPPIIEPEGHVLGGNNRTMILQRAYKNPQSAAAYREMLNSKAGNFGVDPQHISGMKQPVLVREIDPATAPQRAITDFNKTGTAQLTNAERATADARNLHPDVASFIGGKIEAEGDGATLNDALSGKPGVSIVNHLVDSGVFTMQEKPNLIDSRTGTVTAAAKERISKMLTGTMFRDSDQMARIAPEIRNKLERAAPSVLQSQGNPAWDLSASVRGAVDLIEYANAHGIKNLSDAISQEGMFGSEPAFSEKAVAMAEAIKKLTPTELGKRFKAYMIDSVPSMFGEISPETAFNDNFGGVGKPITAGDLMKSVKSASK